jgi:hypothetical protein
MKLLFIYSFTDRGGVSGKQYFNIGLVNAFKKSKEIEFYGLPYADLMTSFGREVMNKRIVEFAKDYKADVVFMQYIDAGDITVESVKEISKVSQVIIWSGDMYVPKVMPFVFDYAPYVVSCFSNMDYISELRQAGYKAEYLNHYCEDIFKPVIVDKKYDITFIGSNFTRYPLSKLRYDMVEFLHDNYGERFNLFGDGWPEKFNAKFIGREESNLVYNQSKIAIHSSNLESPLYFSDRLLHILSSETFCIAEYFPQAETLFEDLVHLMYFSPKEWFKELKILIDYYLQYNNEFKRNNMAHEGRKRCVELFGDEALVRKILLIHDEHKN